MDMSKADQLQLEATPTSKKSLPGQARSYLVLPVLLLIIGGILHFSLGTYSYTATQGDPHVVGADDAYIAFRYGWNLVHYNALSWNESGFRRTEGFTNPLWVYMSALWSLPSDKDLVYPGMVLTSVLVTGVTVVTLSVLTLHSTRSRNGLIGICLLCASPVVWLHTTSGLESGVFGASCALLAYYAFTRDEVTTSTRWFGNILTLLIILLRSDGFVYILILLLGLFLTKSSRWQIIAPGGLLGILILLGWRQVNFGQLLPNTQVAKLNFPLTSRLGTGALFLALSMLNGGIVFLLAGFFGILSLPKSHRLAVLTTLGGWLAYYVYIGGDLFLERHLMAVLFLCAAISGSFFVRMLQDKRGWILVSLMLVGVYLPFYLRDPRFLYVQPKPQDSWILIGKEMALQRDEYGTVVIAPAGKIPFFAGGNFVDELGLNDPVLAKVRRPRFVPGHSAGDHQMALEIARQSSPTYSYFGRNSDLTLDNTQDVLLWAYNLSAQALVHHGLTAREANLLMNAAPLSYSIVFRSK